MKQYICLNHGECNWADETPPREFPLPDGEDQFCPNCESTNIKEKPKPPGPPWLKIAGVLGALILLSGIIWYLLSSDPLILKAESNCETGLITLTTEGGNGSSIIYSTEGLKVQRDSNVFMVPAAKRRGSTFTFFAVQDEEKVEVTCRMDCKSTPPPPPHSPDPITPITRVKWTRVAGSNFCEQETCTLIYNEIDNLGNIRERKIENYSDCCPANQ